MGAEYSKKRSAAPGTGRRRVNRNRIPRGRQNNGHIPLVERPRQYVRGPGVDGLARDQRLRRVHQSDHRHGRELRAQQPDRGNGRALRGKVHDDEAEPPGAHRLQRAGDVVGQRTRARRLSSVGRESGRDRGHAAGRYSTASGVCSPGWVDGTPAGREPDASQERSGIGGHQRLAFEAGTRVQRRRVHRDRLPQQSRRLPRRIAGAEWGVPCQAGPGPPAEQA